MLWRLKEGSFGGRGVVQRTGGYRCPAFEEPAFDGPTKLNLPSDRQLRTKTNWKQARTHRSNESNPAIEWWMRLQRLIEGRIDSGIDSAISALPSTNEGKIDRRMHRWVAWIDWSIDGNLVQCEAGRWNAYCIGKNASDGGHWEGKTGAFHWWKERERSIPVSSWKDRYRIEL